MSLDQIVWIVIAVSVILSTIISLLGAYISAQVGPNEDGEFWPLEVICFLIAGAITIAGLFIVGIHLSNQNYMNHYLALVTYYLLLHAFIQPWLTRRMFNNIGYRSRHGDKI